VCECVIGIYILTWEYERQNNMQEYLPPPTPTQVHLNTIAGRTYNDLTQYPVFPWILTDFTSDSIDLADPKVFRDLALPVGALHAGRWAVYEERHASLKEDEKESGVPAFMYGSHYSNQGVVLHYLSRLEPFTSLGVTLQGGKFEIADRMFSSVQGAWQLSLTAQTDVKELTPEWFYLPEMFKNVNDVPLGVTQDGMLVGDVLLPPWANGSPERFVHIHRQALESEYVSNHLHEWIDLIFGHKQRGRKSVDAKNVFYFVTYEGNVDLDGIEDEVLREATESQIHHFGQTPSQLLTAPHPKRVRRREAFALSHERVVLRTGALRAGVAALAEAVPAERGEGATKQGKEEEAEAAFTVAAHVLADEPCTPTRAASNHTSVVYCREHVVFHLQRHKNQHTARCTLLGGAIAALTDQKSRQDAWQAELVRSGEASVDCPHWFEPPDALAPPPPPLVAVSRNRRVMVSAGYLDNSVRAHRVLLQRAQPQSYSYSSSAKKQKQRQQKNGLDLSINPRSCTIAHHSKICALALSTSNTQLATVDAAGVVCVFNVYCRDSEQHRPPLSSAPTHRFTSLLHDAHSVDFNSAAGVVVVAGARIIQTHSLKRRQLVRSIASLDGDSAWVQMCCSQEGVILTRTARGAVSAYGVNGGLISRVDGSGAGVCGMTMLPFSSDAKHFAADSEECVLLWHADGSLTVRALFGLEGVLGTLLAHSAAGTPARVQSVDVDPSLRGVVVSTVTDGGEHSHSTITLFYALPVISYASGAATLKEGAADLVSSLGVAPSRLKTTAAAAAKSARSSVSATASSIKNRIGKWFRKKT
jgi:hypothetical protein